MREGFFLRICVADSHRVCTPTYFGKCGVTDGLNFPIWKVKMTLFLKSLGFRVTEVFTKEFIERHGDGDTWSEASAKNYEANTKA